MERDMTNKELLQALLQQVAEVSGHAADETRGMTLRELVLENRRKNELIEDRLENHMKEKVHTGAVGRSELLAYLVGAVSIVGGLAAFI